MSATYAGSRLTEAHRLAQSRLGAQTVQNLRPIWSLLDPVDIDGSFQGWLDAVLTIIRSQRSSSARLAATYVDLYKKAELGASALTPILTLAEAVPVEAAATSLWVTGPIRIRQAIGRGVDLSRALDLGESQSSAVAMRHVLNGGRQTILSAVQRDPQIAGWQRVTSGNPCDFCSMLADRGAVYSEDTVDFEAHAGCNCSAEIVMAEPAIFVA